MIRPFDVTGNRHCAGVFLFRELDLYRQKSAISRDAVIICQTHTVVLELSFYQSTFLTSRVAPLL